MNEVAVLTVLCMHLFVCAAYFALTRLHIAHASDSVLIIMVLVPVFGPLSVLGFEWARMGNHAGTSLADIENQLLCDGTYNKIMVEDDDKTESIIPLEEAILINDSLTRRSIMIDILHHNPAQYLKLLKIARFNEDIEVAHYATTTIMEIQRDFELSISRQLAYLQDHQDDEEALDRYIDILGEYIDSGLLEGYLLSNQRKMYSRLLRRKIVLCPDNKQAYFRMADNETQMQNYMEAEKILEEMLNKWPDDENVWFSGVQLYVESKNSRKMEMVLDRMKSAPIRWTAKGKEKMKFWSE